ncbi:MAG: glutamine amidotransferase [Armatimonadota bacterium]
MPTARRRRPSLLFRLMALALLLAAPAAAPAVEVSALQEGDEYRFAFKGGAFPYVLRLWKAPVGKYIVSGLGLRGPWWEDPYFSNAWAYNSFFDIRINGKRVIGELDAYKQYPDLFTRCEVLESGERTLVEYQWERDEATVRLRFALVPGCRALLGEVLLEPKKPLESLSISLTSFPGGYTPKGDGERRMRTAQREVSAPAQVDLNLPVESAILFADARLDRALPINTRGGHSTAGCAGLYLESADFRSAQVQVTGYPVEITLHARPGITRLRFALDEFPMSNAQAFSTLQETAPIARKLLTTAGTFIPAALTGFSATREGEKIARLRAAKTVPAELIQALETAKKSAEGAIAHLFGKNAQPVTGEQAALQALDRYRRLLSTAQRYADTRLRMYEMRGPGAVHFGVAPAAAAVEAEVVSGYLFVGGQGRGVTPFPGTIDELYRYDAVLMLDIDTRALSSQQLQLLKQYVEDGGGLAIFGGFYSYGASNIGQTALGELLPLRGADGKPFDLRQRKATETLQVRSSTAFLRGVRWEKSLVSPWYHALAPAPRAQVLISQGQSPWLAIRAAGRGHVLCCAGTVMGEATPGTTSFYQWKSWPALLGCMLRWLAGK